MSKQLQRIGDLFGLETILGAVSLHGPTRYSQGVASVVHVLTASDALSPHEGRIREIATRTLERIAERLPLEGVDVVVQDHPAAAIVGLGIGGFAPNAHLIQISLDPGFERFDNAIEAYLPRILCHEAHHCARWRGPGYGTSLGEALITEGLADHFDLEMNGGSPFPWATALSATDLRDWWMRAAVELWEPKYDHASWFFGGQKDEPPVYTGYSLGFWLVEEFLAGRPGTSASSLWDAAAIEMIQAVLPRIHRVGT